MKKQNLLYDYPTFNQYAPKLENVLPIKRPKYVASHPDMDQYDEMVWYVHNENKKIFSWVFEIKCRFLDGRSVYVDLPNHLCISFPADIND